MDIKNEIEITESERELGLWLGVSLIMKSGNQR